MMNYDIKDLNEKYDLELSKVISNINKNKYKLVLLQFPDGLKPYALAVVDYLESKTKAEFLIWMGSCFGACDTPVGLEKIKPKIDMLVQFGHSNMMPSY